MRSTVFGAVLQVSLQITLPLLFVSLCTPILRNYIQAKTFLKIKKVMLVGILFSIVPAYFGPFVQFPVLRSDTSFLNLDFNLPSQLLETEIIILARNIDNSIITIGHILFLLEVTWICGMVLYACRIIGGNMNLIHCVQNMVPCNSSQHICELCDNLCKEIDLRESPAIVFSSEQTSPQTVGWIHPIIVLPSQELPTTDDGLKMLLLHELHHCKGRDNGWKALTLVLLTIYWFHPLIRWVVSSFARECELVCDEKILRGTAASTKHEYTEMLLKFSAQCDFTSSLSSLQSNLRSNFAATEQRVKQIYLVDSKKPGRSFLLLSLLFLFPCLGIIEYQKPSNAVPSFVTNYVNPNFTEAGHFLLSENPKGLSTDFEFNIDSSKKQYQFPIVTNNIIHRRTGGSETHRNTLCFLATSENVLVVSICDGTIVAIQEKETMNLNENELMLGSLGKYIIIDCGSGLSIRYTFLDSIFVQPGQTVSAGDVLGTAGHTGASYGNTDQCGICILQDGIMVDPLPYFDFDIPIETASY